MSLLLKNALILATENGEFKELKNAYLGISGDRIDYIGTERPEAAYDEEKDLSGKLLMPGLVNGHAHSAMNLLTGVGGKLPLMEWLQTVWPLEGKMRDEEYISGMEMVILEMLAGGTTSFSDMYMHGPASYPVIGESGIKSNMTYVVNGGTEDMDYKSYEKRVEAIKFREECNGLFDDRLHVDWCIHAEYTISDYLAKSWAEEIREYGGCFHTHLCETQFETQNCIDKRGKTPVEWFADLGYFDLKTYAAHCVWLTENDMDIMKEYGVSPVHNPTSNLKLGSGIAPVPGMLEKGLNVCLGTDGSASNNNVNMFEEMHIASILQKGYHQDPMLIMPEDVIRMATVNGAMAQDRPDTGSIEIGKKADIIAIDLDAPYLIPNTDTASLITYAMQASDVCMTMVDGKILYENGEYLTMDRERIYADFKESCKFLGVVE